MAVEDSVAQDQIRAFVERIERMESEKAAISADIKEIYAEAKGNGFDVKILRRVVGIRKQDANERFEQEALLELYMSALGMVAAPPEGVYDGERERLNSIASQLRSEVKKPDPLAALRADPALAIVEPSNLRPKSENQLPQPAGGDLAVPSPGVQVAHPSQAKASTDGGTTEQGIETPADSVTGDASRASVGAGSDAPNSVSSDRPEGQAMTSLEPHQMDRHAVTAGETASSEGSRQSALASELAGRGNVSDNESVTGGESAATEIQESLRAETPAGQGAAARRDEAEETVKSAEVQASAAPASKYAAPGVVVWEHTPPEPVKRHPYSQAFGEMGQDLAVIDDDIAGAKSEPIVRVGSEILDGWARYNCARGMIGGSGISTEYPVKQYDGDNALVDCIRWNVTGRIMTDKQLQLAAKRLIEIEPNRKAEILATFEALSA